MKKYIVLALSLTFVASCKNESSSMTKIKAPVASKVPKKLEIHNDVRVDDYYWMNDRDDEKVISYLNEENSYYNSLTKHTKDFQNTLFEEMKGRIKEDDASVPYKNNGYWYATRYEKGKEYPIYSRRKGTETTTEEIMFNCNEMAKGHEYFNLGGISISPNNSMASFGVDTISRREYSLQIKNLHTGEVFPDVIEKTTGSSVWADDNKTIFYTKKDPVTLRSDKIYRHVLGTSTKDDVLVFHEEDETYNTFVYKTKSKKYIVIGSSSTLTSEYRFINADEPES